VRKQIAVTTTEIEAARVEQDNLLDERTALTKAADYCAASLQAVQAVVSAAMDKVKSDYHHAVEGLAWLGLQVYSPTDSQLHVYLANRDLEGLNDMSEKMTQRSVDLFVQWEEEPESRENIEAQLEKIRTMRVRCLRYLVQTRPETAQELLYRRLMPTGPDGSPNPKLVEAVALLKLTPEQLEAFGREWTLYLQHTEALRQEARSTLSFLTSSATVENAAEFCSIGAAGLFLERLQAVAELEVHPSIEASAIISLLCWIPANLTMHQKAILMKYSMPFYPDAIQLGRILFGDGNGNTIEGHSVPISEI
jgi:hypothetical protein